MTNREETKQPAKRRAARIDRLVVVLVIVTLVVIGGAIAGTRALGAYKRQRLLTRLESGTVEEKRAMAWRVAKNPFPEAISLMVRELESGRPADEELREGFIYAVSRTADPRYLEVAGRLLREDPSGYVRQAAWPAAARLDPDGFRRLAAELPQRDDGWDEIGRAQGWLVLWDTRGVDALLHWAVAGDETQRRVVSHVLLQRVAPLIEVAGRWPAGETIGKDELWPPELVAEVSRRVAELDLQQIADDTRPHLIRSEGIRRNVARLHSARNHIAKFIFAG